MPISEVNEETLELLERRLSERVKRRVYYTAGMFGSGFFAVLIGLSYFFYERFEDSFSTFVESYKTTVQQTAESEARQAVELKSTEVNSLIAKLEQESIISLELNEKLRIDLETQNEWREKNHLKIERLVTRLDDISVKIRISAEDFETQFEKQKTEFQKQKDDVDKNFQSIVGEGRNLYLGHEYAKHIEDLGSDVESFRLVLEQFKTAIDDLGGEPVNVPQTKNSVLSGKDKGSDQSAKDYVTVKINFAGSVDRDEIEFLSSIMNDVSSGNVVYTIPKEKRIGSAAAKSELVYYYDADREVAVTAAKDLNEALRHIGFKSTVEPKPAVKEEGALPPPGVLELYIEPIRQDSDLTRSWISDVATCNSTAFRNSLNSFMQGQRSVSEAGKNDPNPVSNLHDRVFLRDVYFTPEFCRSGGRSTGAPLYNCTASGSLANIGRVSFNADSNSADLREKVQFDG